MFCNIYNLVVLLVVIVLKPRQPQKQDESCGTAGWKTLFSPIVSLEETSVTGRTFRTTRASDHR